MEPLVEAFGYTQRARRGLRGRRRDRVARRARAACRPAGSGDDRDRRPRRLPADRRGRAGEGDGDRARDHRDEDLRPPGGDRPLRHRARADPRLLRPEGRHLGQHPGHPGDRRQDRQRAAADVRDARGGARATSRRSKGAKRKQNLVEHAEDARMSASWRPCGATSRSTSTSRSRRTREPDRSRLREIFREFELRDPLRRLEEALGDPDVAAPASATEVTLTATLRAGAPADIAGSAPATTEICLVVRGDRGARGRAVRRGLAVALRGRCRGRGRRRRLRRARGGGRGLRRARRVVAHDAKALRTVPGRLAHDTLLGAYLLEPARRGYPLDGAVRGARARQRPRGSARGEAVLLGALADWQREQIAERGLEAVMAEIELPLVPGAARDGAARACG